MFDVIVIGGRCAGAPTAMLLARRGHRVLLCDRASFPSDTVSTGAFQPPGLQYLRRWGLFDQMVATGVPPVSRLLANSGRRQECIELPTEAWLYAPRRRVLDQLLIDAAVASGVEFRERTSLADVVRDPDGSVVGVELAGAGGATIVEQARLVVGADGRHSSLARLLDLHATATYRLPGHGAYAHYTDVPCDAYEFHVPGGLSSAWVMLNPTNDGMTCVTTAGLRKRRSPLARFEAAINAVPAVRGRLEAGSRQDRVVGYPMEPMHYRPAYGPGWALVGDAGFHQGPTSGLGMSHAFRDADALSAAAADWLGGAMTFDAALQRYAEQRDHASKPIYDTIADAYRAMRLGPLGGHRAAAIRQKQQDLVTAWAQSIDTAPARPA